MSILNYSIASILIHNQHIQPVNIQEQIQHFVEEGGVAVKLTFVGINVKCLCTYQRWSSIRGLPPPLQKRNAIRIWYLYVFVSLFLILWTICKYVKATRYRILLTVKTYINERKKIFIFHVKIVNIIVLKSINLKFEFTFHRTP